jgi:hypothetical protein
MHTLGDSDLPHAIVRMVFGHMENLYWRPDWWESLFRETRERLLNRFHTGVHPLIEIPHDFLCDDGLRAVRWRVVGRQTNASEILSRAHGPQRTEPDD